jgi:hypothetical protein
VKTLYRTSSTNIHPSSFLGIGIGEIYLRILAPFNPKIVGLVSKALNIDKGFRASVDPSVRDSKLITQARCIISVSSISIGIGASGRSTARKCLKPSSDERARGEPNSMHIPNHQPPTSFLHRSSNTNELTPSLSSPLSNVPPPNHRHNRIPTLSDLTVTQRYRTRPFRPDPQTYEPVIHDESNVVFGIDLCKWSESSWYALAHSEERSSYHQSSLCSWQDLTPHTTTHVLRESDRKSTNFPLRAVRHLDGIPPEFILFLVQVPMCRVAFKLWMLVESAVGSL